MLHLEHKDFTPWFRQEVGQCLSKANTYCVKNSLESAHLHFVGYRLFLSNRQHFVPWEEVDLHGEL